jgi:hypothetical protein
MNRMAILAAALVLFSGAYADAQRGFKGRGGEAEAVENGWLFSLAEGKALAVKTNKPLMVVVRCVP